MKETTTVSSPYDPAAEITMIQNNTSLAIPAVIRLFTAGL
jgi:hypothetical protein